MLKFYYLNTDCIDESSANNLSTFRLNKSNNFVFDKDKKLSLGAAILLKQGLSELYNLNEEELEYGFNEYGKPYIKNHLDIHFNISHSFKMSIVVFSSNNVGCDIEAIRKYDESVVNRCYSIKEKEYVLNSKDRDLAFTKIWIHKESFFKCLGIGLNKSMNEISIIIDDSNNSISVIQNINSNKYVFEERKIDDYLISICYQKD